jgi:Domain of unknown function (DUF4342)
MTEQPVRTEEYVVSGDKLVAKVKELIHESNIRRISLKDEQGKTLIEIPLTLGVIGALLIPTWAAIGAIAALVVDLRIVVEKVKDEGGAAPDGKAPEALLDEVSALD